MQNSTENRRKVMIEALKDQSCGVEFVVLNQLKWNKKTHATHFSREEIASDEMQVIFRFIGPDWWAAGRKLRIPVCFASVNVPPSLTENNTLC